MQSQYSPPQEVATPVLEYVGIGPRSLATLIDSILLMIVIGLIGIAFRAGLTFVHGSMTYIPSGPAGILQIIIPFLYYIILEATMGATVGKRVVGLRVVKVGGSPVSWGGSIIRNLLRMVDGLFGYLLGGIFVISSPMRQRLGDRLAKTVVIRRR